MAYEFSKPVETGEPVETVTQKGGETSFAFGGDAASEVSASLITPGSGSSALDHHPTESGVMSIQGGWAAEGSTLHETGEPGHAGEIELSSDAIARVLQLRARRNGTAE